MWRVLMLAVLGVAVVFTAAVAPTTCSDSHAGAKRNACMTNLRALQGVKADWAKSFGITNLDVAPETTATNQFGWKQHLGNRPQCPAGGRYWLGRLGEPPRCSISGHTL